MIRSWSYEIWWRMFMDHPYVAQNDKRRETVSSK